MTQEELETRVYDRMSAEYDTLLDELRIMTPQDIIDNAYQIVMKQDILFSMENHFLSIAQLQLLANLDTPLDELYQNWLEGDYSYMETLEDSTKDFVDSRLKAQAAEKYCKPDSPIYVKSMREAGDAGELHEWRASHDRDRACKLDFNDGVGKSYNTGEFIPYLRKWTEKYGLDRCVRLLAYTVRKHDYDGRYNPSVKNRASYIRFPDGDRISDLEANVHSCIINASMCELVKLEQERGNTFTIYQLKSGDALHNICFESLERLNEAGATVPASNYRRVYTALIDPGTTLEDIFERFNINNPPDFYGHSLSVSDVVALRRNGKEGAFYCDSIGFVELPDFRSAEAEQELPQKSKRREGMER